MNELFANGAQFMWLVANTWWMIGDIHDHDYPNEDEWYPQRTKDCGNIMVAAIVILCFFYAVIKPWKLLNVDDPVATAHYDRTGLQVSGSGSVSGSSGSGNGSVSSGAVVAQLWWPWRG